MAEVPTQPQSQPTTQGINWKNILIGAVIGVVVVGIIGALVFYLYQGSSEETTPTTTPKTSTPSAKTSTPEAKKDETADWKIYTNDTFDYSIKYPSDWPISSTSNGNLLLNQTGKKAQLTEEELNRPTISIYQSEFTCSSNYKNCDLVGDVSIGGVMWEKYTFEDSDGTKHEVYFYEGKNLQIFTTPKNQQNLIDKVIATFKFPD